jgi:hypothetical protein
MKCDKEPGYSECESLMLERIRYFTGRHMTARDFSDADAYHRTMRHLHNRVLHGTGIACGLEVTPHDTPECGVVVRCGLAIDCCGREIVVPKAISSRIDWDQWPKLENSNDRDPAYVLVLCLEYCEVLTEKVPVLYSTTACATCSYESGRIRESYALRWRAVKELDLEKYGWHTTKGCAPTQDDPCDKPPAHPCGGPNSSACCLDPNCPPCHCVALAVVKGDEDRTVILTEGRLLLRQSQEQLTHICWTSWRHGGYLRLSDFHDVRVRFDRPLAHAEVHHDWSARGINERTFVMQYGQQREDLDFVMFTHQPHLLPDRRTASFHVLSPHEYINNTIQVTIRCDFLLDCNDNPVDGDHLRGRLPTGNGVPGGVFESWFRLITDEEYERRVQAHDPGVMP